MRAVLLGVAASVAALAISAPAGAQQTNFVAGPTLQSHHDGRFDGRLLGSRRDSRFDCGIARDGRHDRRHRRGDRSLVECSSGIWVNGGEWALYNNRAFDSDSYNDWWHDRPDRAYPRWVQEQRGTAGCDPDRMWWSGSGWHC